MSLQSIDVLGSLRKYIKVDGYDLILDLDKSNGYWLYDSKSNSKYLDFFSFFASAPIGLNHPDVLKDQEFLKRLQSAAINKVSNSDFYTEEYATFVNTFADVAIPEEFKHAFFISGGALGVENALKASFDWKVRLNFAKGIKSEKGQQILHFREAFHGRTGYTLSLTNTADPRKYMYYPRFNWPRVLNPKITFPLEENLEKVIQSEETSINQINDAFSKNKDDIAGIIIEPIQGEGGDNHFRPEFFKKLRNIADENETMLIFDEVQTGIAMTGKMWAYEHTGVTPDLIAFGKKMQVCGFLSTERIDQVEKNVFQESTRINSTWGGNLVDMVRSTKYLEIIRDHDLIGNANKMGNILIKGLYELQEKYPEIIHNVRGKGLLIAFDMKDTETRDKTLKSIYNDKMILLKCGLQSIRFRPPLIIDEEAIEKGLNIIEDNLKKVNS